MINKEKKDPQENKPTANKEEIEMNKKEQKEQREEIRDIKVALITATPLLDLPIKALSGLLKQESLKEDSRVAYSIDKFNLGENKHQGEFKREIIEQLVEKLKDRDFIGISAVGFNFDEKIAPLIKELKNRLPDKPVILGGDIATDSANMERCWQLGIDAMCIGEAEKDLPFLLENWDNRLNPEIKGKIKNFILEDDDVEKIKTGKISAKSLQNFLTKEEMNEYKTDFTWEDYYVLKDEKIVEALPSYMPEAIQHQLPQNENVLIYAFTRGCPYACDYCDYATKQEQTDQKFRSKSMEVAVEELKRQKIELEKARKKQVELGLDKGPEPFLVLMNSDTSALSTEQLKRFRDLYKKDVGLPFYCMCSPSSLTPEKIKILADAGMVHLNIGVQTNQESNEKFFRRKQKDDNIVELTRTAKELGEEGIDIKLFYDFIIYNPFEDKDQIRKTIELIKKMEPPFDYIPHTLFLGSGSPLRKKYDREKEEKGLDKLLEDNTEIGYSNYHDTYRFYSWLKDNREFVINTICEFMAGQHNNEKLGRLPRYAKDLANWDVFEENNLLSTARKEMKKINDVTKAESYIKEKENQIAEFRKFIDEKLSAVDEKTLSIDFLTNDDILAYFESNKNLFINIALVLKDLPHHHQRFSNEKKEKRTYESEFEDTSTNPIF